MATYRAEHDAETGATTVKRDGRYVGMVAPVGGSGEWSASRFNSARCSHTTLGVSFPSERDALMSLFGDEGSGIATNSDAVTGDVEAVHLPRLAALLSTPAPWEES